MLGKEIEFFVAFLMDPILLILITLQNPTISTPFSVLLPEELWSRLCLLWPRFTFILLFCTTLFWFSRWSDLIYCIRRPKYSRLYHSMISLNQKVFFILLKIDCITHLWSRNSSISFLRSFPYLVSSKFMESAIQYFIK